MYSDQDIMKLINDKSLLVLPFKRENLRPNGIRVHMSNQIMVPIVGSEIDLKYPEDVPYTKVDIDEETGYVFKPNSFILASTIESFKMPRNVVGMLDGRSTIARLGITIHCTSGIIDNMFSEKRTIVLEMFNMSPFNIKIYPGLPIGMVSFYELTSDVLSESQLQYKDQIGVQGPNLFFKA